jgi:uncharacterized cofD-like protein
VKGTGSRVQGSGRRSRTGRSRALLPAPLTLIRRALDPDLHRWLVPGMQVKRWLLLLMFGVAVMGLGIAYLLREFYLYATLPSVFYYITLQFIPRVLRGLLFMSISTALILLAVFKLTRSLLEVVERPGPRMPLSRRVWNHRFRPSGPSVVAIGGGTGLSRLLLGLKEHTDRLTAIVSVGDDGGSSGRLRQEFNVLPPGDVRNCIAALAEADEEMRRLFQYRFEEGSGLEGHSFGNLFIVALSAITGSFEEAVRATSRILAVRGQIIPLTPVDITLGAEMADGEVVMGESHITRRGKRIRRLFLTPPDAPAYPEALEAIAAADLIVIGPGSLYTSVLPNLLVADIREAVRRARGFKVYVCNVATQHGETDGFTVADHVRVIIEHAGEGLIDCVLANENVRHGLPEAWMSDAVEPAGELPPGVHMRRADVVQENKRYHHDPAKLARALLRLYDDREQYALEAIARPPVLHQS